MALDTVDMHHPACLVPLESLTMLLLSVPFFSHLLPDRFSFPAHALHVVSFAVALKGLYKLIMPREHRFALGSSPSCRSELVGAGSGERDRESL